MCIRDRVDGQTVTIEIANDTGATEANKLIYNGPNKEGVRQRNAFGIYCTGAWYRGTDGKIYYGKDDNDAYENNTTGMGYQARESLELKLSHAGETATADPVSYTHLGSVVEYGSTREIVRYSAHPYTQNLIQAVPKMNQPVFRAAGIAMRARESSGCPYVNHCPEKKKICEEQMPAFQKISDGHYVRCWQSGGGL